MEIWTDVLSFFFSKRLRLYPPLLSSGVAGLRGSFTLSSWTGEEVRWSTLAGVRALLGRAFGVEGLPRVDGGLGEAAGLGDVGLPLAVAGDDGRLDNGLRLEGWSRFRVVEKPTRETLYTFRTLLDSGSNVLDLDIFSMSLTLIRGSKTDKALKHCITLKCIISQHPSLATLGEESIMDRKVLP